MIMFPLCHLELRENNGIALYQSDLVPRSREPHATADRLSVTDAQTLLKEEPHFSSGNQRSTRRLGKCTIKAIDITGYFNPDFFQKI